VDAGVDEEVATGVALALGACAFAGVVWAEGVEEAAAGAAVEVAAGVEESAELDFFERLDFLVVEVVEDEASALVAADLLASALAAELVVEDFFELELFLAVLEESELSAAAAESAVADFLDFELDFEAELSAAASLPESESDFLDLDFDLEAEESVSFESEDCFASADVSDFLDLDLVFGLGAPESV
jgi:hypothetical protein